MFQNWKVVRNNLFPKKESDPLSEIVREQHCWRACGLAGLILHTPCSRNYSLRSKIISYFWFSKLDA